METLEVDIDRLAEILISEFVGSQKNLDSYDMDEYFGDNIESFMRDFGLPADVDLDESDLDYIYDEISSKLIHSLEEKLYNKSDE